MTRQFRRAILILIFWIPGIMLIAQDLEQVTENRPLNSLNLNLLGDASLISLNYERLHLIRRSFILSFKLGLGMNQEFRVCLFSCPVTEPETYYTIPHHITGNIGGGKHFIEFGLGGTSIIGNTTQSYIIYPIIGYRLLSLNSKKINFRIFAQFPFSGIITKDILFIPIGTSIGFSF